MWTFVWGHAVHTYAQYTKWYLPNTFLIDLGLSLSYLGSSWFKHITAWLRVSLDYEEGTITHYCNENGHTWFIWKDKTSALLQMECRSATKNTWWQSSSSVIAIRKSVIEIKTYWWHTCWFLGYCGCAHQHIRSGRVIKGKMTLENVIESSSNSMTKEDTTIKI